MAVGEGGDVGVVVEGGEIGEVGDTNGLTRCGLLGNPELWGGGLVVGEEDVVEAGGLPECRVSAGIAGELGWGKYHDPRSELVRFILNNQYGIVSSMGQSQCSLFNSILFIQCLRGFG